VSSEWGVIADQIEPGIFDNDEAGGQSENRLDIGVTEKSSLLVEPEDPAMVGNGTNEEHGGESGAEQAHLIEISFESVEATKPDGERQGKEKPKEHLHTETRYPKFL